MRKLLLTTIILIAGIQRTIFKSPVPPVLRGIFIIRENPTRTLYPVGLRDYRLSKTRKSVQVRFFMFSDESFSALFHEAHKGSFGSNPGLP